MNPLRHFRVLWLHSLNEVGAPPARRYRAASTMLRLALLEKDGPPHEWLHYALDVILCEGRIRELRPGTDFHRQYWWLGHRIATEIIKQQDELNISNFWLSESYEQALQVRS